ncbi:hypothetical protein M440DRAFT_1402601 [Trichoderma longibrachiatum ATCC 18648]|uniref:Uncharacterized protein n=1 Tax=Trichoderma longibrachiatum ATCC 18648 TaxID=983965 RepID=A0A2T4C0D2_TRILO|nr:hypothetical protein M440DRAFT_1402601 [Trichoderma longibrachiatum ATCC 18648]
MGTSLRGCGCLSCCSSLSASVCSPSNVSMLSSRRSTASEVDESPFCCLCAAILLHPRTHQNETSPCRANDLTACIHPRALASGTYLGGAGSV